MDGGQGRELAVTEAVTAVMIEGQLAVAALHAGAAALEQLGTGSSDGFDTLAQHGFEGLERMCRLAQRCKPLRAERRNRFLFCRLVLLCYLNSVTLSEGCGYFGCNYYKAL